MNIRMSLVQRRPLAAAQGNGLRKTLIGLLLFNGIGAVFGGIGLLTDSIGAPRSLLDGTPFADFTLPGWLLLVVVGGTSLGAAVGLWKRAGYADVAVMFAGAVLLGWIVTEFVMIPQGWMFQLLFVIVALVILRGGWLLYDERRAPRAVV